jgi:hypothetical protein
MNDDERSKLLDWVRIERQFRDDLRSINLEVINVASDGNCLFHSVSVQLYGRTEAHQIIR